MIAMRKCTKCKKYSLREKCPDCGADSISPIPAKYSPEDPYGSYRRTARKERFEKGGRR